MVWLLTEGDFSSTSSIKSISMSSGGGRGKKGGLPNNQKKKPSFRKERKEGVP